MSKPRSHQLDIYGTWLHLATDRKAWRKHRKLLPSLDKEPPEAAGAVMLTLHHPPDATTVTHLTIWLDLDAHTASGDLIDTAAHEATHAATALLDHISQAYDANSEALAYLVGWITCWIWKHCT